MAEAATAGTKRKQRKARYKTNLERLLQEYKNVLVVGVDNVGSLQMQRVRMALRGKAIMIMGKNTLMRMIIREQMERNPKLEILLQHIRGNVGLVFTNEDLARVRTIIVEYKVPASAKSGTFAPSDVFVPPGPTGLDPGQTGFFQALNIGTKIVKGAIEIINQVHLIRKGDKITSSAVALLSKLDIKPFFYGIVALQVYENGSMYPAAVLDITRADVQAKFLAAASRLTALSLAINYPSELTFGVSLANSWRKLLAVSLAAGYKFKEADAALKAASSGGGGGGAGGGGADVAKGKGKDKDAGKGKDAGKDKGKGKKEKEEKKEEKETDGDGDGEDVNISDLFG